MANVRFDRRHTYSDALKGDSGTIYFTTDTKDIVLDGNSYSIRRVPNTTLSITEADGKYIVNVTGVDAIRDPGEYLCYSGETISTESTTLFKLTIVWAGTIYKQIIYPNLGVTDLDPATDYIYRTVNVSNDGTAFEDWVVVKDDHSVNWID